MTLLLLAQCQALQAQELVQVTDETITVNSIMSLTGSTRNTTAVKLPERTKAYVYRISVSPKGKNTVTQSLMQQLMKLGGAEFALAASVAQLAIENNDNDAVDAFIFTTVYDADDFYSKKEGNWGACQIMLNRASCCFVSEQCMGRNIYFGFRNNNVSKGLNVRLEVVAIVDDMQASAYTYSYNISNGSNRELTYGVSIDNINWEENSLRNDYRQTFNFAQQELFFRIHTDVYKSSVYKLVPNERYRIFWNTQLMKWDLGKY